MDRRRRQRAAVAPTQSIGAVGAFVIAFGPVAAVALLAIIGRLH